MKRITLTIATLFALSAPNYGALLDNFDRTDSTTVGGGWVEVNTGAGNSSITGNRLRILNGNPAGRSYVVSNTAALYTTVLANNTSVIEWSFNMRQVRTDPSGFGSGNYGVAFVLGGDNSSLLDGDGYAVVLGQSGSTDAIRLARYTGGLDGTLNNIISGGDYGNEYLNIRVVYDGTGANNSWTLYVTSSTTAFSDPSGITTQIGSTTTDSTHTGKDLKFVGCLWNHSTAANQDALFDNVSVPNGGGAPPPSGPNVTITNPAAAVQYVPSSTASYTLYGTNANIAGTLIVSNNAALLTSTLAPAGNAWNYNVASLSMGSNVIVVTGTNTAGSRATASVLIIRNVLPPQNFTATALNSSEISLAWDKNAQNNDVLLVRHTAAISGTPSGSYTAGDAFPGGGTVIYVGGDTTYDDTGLNSSTTYYYKLWSKDGTSYSDGVTASATTSNVTPPVATAATNVNQTSFTANWNPVAGASGYMLDVATNQFGSGAASDLFISEYCEGSSNNKYIEIYNGTGASVDLSTYKLKIAANGAAFGSDISLGTGNLANGDVFVIANNSANATISNAADLTSGSITFNGNDAVGLFKNSTAIDIIGVQGVDPGSEWPVGTMGTANNTLVRKSSIAAGNISWATCSNEWDTYAQDTTTYLGAHTMSGGGTTIYVPGYSNLYVAGTSQGVSGLNANSWYYYRVKAIAGGVTTDYSNIISVKTGSTPLGFVDITAPPTNSTVSSSSFNLQGTNDLLVVGGMIVSNMTTGAAWQFAAPGAALAWNQSITLDNGPNQIRAMGTNIAGHVAYDTVTITYSVVLPDSFVSWVFDTPGGTPDTGYGVISPGASPVMTNWPFSGGNYGGHGLIFTEIMVNPSGTESSGNSTTEWLELYNTGPVALNLLNFAVGDANISYGGLTNIVGEAEIEVGEFVVICPPGRALGLTSAWDLVGVKVYEVGSNWPNFNNTGGDRVYLSNTVDEVIVDEFTYGSGWPAFSSGQSMYLNVTNPTQASNDVSSAWTATGIDAENLIPNPGGHGGVTWGTSDYGTPGVGPYQDTYDSFLQCLGSTGWPAAQANNKYVQFAFNTNMTQVTMYMDLKRDANGPQNVQVQYSVDGTTWENGTVFNLAAADTWYSQSNTFALAQFENQPNAGIRLVAYSAATEAGGLCIDNIYGTGIVPEPAAALLVMAGLLGLRGLRGKK